MIDSRWARDARTGLSAGIWLSLALCMALWLAIDSIAFALVHFVLLTVAWLIACILCEGAVRRVVLVAGAIATIAGIFGLLAVFLREYN